MVDSNGRAAELVHQMLANAAESTGSDGGVVWISADEVLLQSAPDGLAPGIEMAPGPYVRLEIRDAGAGMDPTTVARMVDPFFSTRFGGRGLGGGELFLELRRLDPDVAALFNSGYLEPELPEGAYGDRVGFLQKRYRFKTLRLEVEKLLAVVGRRA